MAAAISNPLELPDNAARVVAAFIADAIEFAHSAWPAKWGLTDYQPDVRLNVGFTEVLTTSESELRCIVVAGLVTDAQLGRRIKVIPGKNGEPYYPSIPESVCVEVSYRPANTLEAVLERAKPALFEAIRRSGRRGLGRGVRAGHSPDLVREIGRYVRRVLPQPEHVAQSVGPLLENSSGEFFEGALRRALANRFERNPAARAACIAHYGPQCQVCGFSFVSTFGELGDGFVHVHHSSPIAKAGGKYTVDPIRDLSPVCPNCHAMLHTSDPPLTIDELRGHMARSRDDA